MDQSLQIPCQSEQQAVTARPTTRPTEVAVAAVKTKTQRQSQIPTMTEEDKNAAKVLKEEMKWHNKANKTPTILEVLEFKADLIEGRL